MARGDQLSRQWRIVSWVMSWGAKAEVIGPESLLEAVPSEVRCMGKHYSTIAENKKPSRMPG